jgi:hypothetical protein
MSEMQRLLLNQLLVLLRVAHAFESTEKVVRLLHTLQSSQSQHPSDVVNSNQMCDCIARLNGLAQEVNNAMEQALDRHRAVCATHDYVAHLLPQAPTHRGMWAAGQAAETCDRGILQELLNRLGALQLDLADLSIGTLGGSSAKVAGPTHGTDATSGPRCLNLIHDLAVTIQGWNANNSWSALNTLGRLV